MWSSSPQVIVQHADSRRQYGAVPSWERKSPQNTSAAQTHLREIWFPPISLPTSSNCGAHLSAASLPFPIQTPEGTTQVLPHQ